MKLAHLAAAVAGAFLLVVFGAADAKTVTKSCKKDLSSGEYIYDTVGISEDYIINVTAFREASRDGRYAYGTCTIDLKYQPAD